MSSKRTVTFCEITNGITPISKKRDGLIHLQALTVQDLKEPSPRLGIVAGNQPKASGCSVSSGAFPDDYFKRAILALRLRTGVNVATIQAHHEWRSRFGQFVPLSRTALDKRGLLVAQFAFKTLGHLVNVP